MPKLTSKHSRSKKRGKKKLRIDAKIENLKYNPLLCQQLKTFTTDEFLSGQALENAAFLLNHDRNTFAISHWVSLLNALEVIRTPVFTTR
jgi:hypothetical protein